MPEEGLRGSPRRGIRGAAPGALHNPNKIFIFLESHPSFADLPPLPPDLRYDPAYLSPFPTPDQIPNPNLILNPYPIPPPDPDPPPDPFLDPPLDPDPDPFLNILPDPFPNPNPLPPPS